MNLLNCSSPDMLPNSVAIMPTTTGFERELHVVDRGPNNFSSCLW